ncbi:unnamed protein product, partial [Owenia fusiformis]
NGGLEFSALLDFFPVTLCSISSSSVKEMAYQSFFEGSFSELGGNSCTFGISLEWHRRKQLATGPREDKLFISWDIPCIQNLPMHNPYVLNVHFCLTYKFIKHIKGYT